jgi:hypothetical protein
MTGLKMTTMTLKEMRATRVRGESKTAFAFLHWNKLAGIEPEDDEDSPDTTLAIREAITLIVALGVQQVVAIWNRLPSNLTCM